MVKKTKVVPDLGVDSRYETDMDYADWRNLDDDCREVVSKLAFVRSRVMG